MLTFPTIQETIITINTAHNQAIIPVVLDGRRTCLSEREKREFTLLQLTCNKWPNLGGRSDFTSILRKAHRCHRLSEV